MESQKAPIKDEVFQAFGWLVKTIDLLSEPSNRDKAGAVETLCGIAECGERMVAIIENESVNCERSNLQNAKPVSCETLKVGDSKTVKAACFSEEELVRFYNDSVISLELLFEAARDGSRDAAEFLHEQADRFIMKAGDVS
jgi:hypothetical protein